MSEEQKVFCLLYCSIVSFQFHPGNKKRLSPQECVSETFAYMGALSGVLDKCRPGGELWRG